MTITNNIIATDFQLSLNRKKGKFTLSYGEFSVEQNVCEFLCTISFLVGKDIEENLISLDSEHDYVRIPLTGCGKTITLDLVEFIRFREVYNQEMYMLRLEDMLMRKGVALS